MTTATTYPHLTFDAEGTARIGATRYKVLHLAAEHYYYGWTAEELLRQHPDLRPEEVYAALAYFYDHFDELTERLKQSAEQATAEAAHAVQPLSRRELLARRAAKGL
ncbi:MAG: DUF433 domain-containing protein [Candidatus Saccharimonas sp.]|nr:DUF433 domain-containing protein [Planctomycetaceae bacterium]